LEEKLRTLAFVVLGMFYIGFLLPQWIGVFERHDGRAWVGFVLLVIMSGDSAAYFIGRRFGRQKLAPVLSPGKTREGAWGYLAGSIGVAGLGLSFMPLAIGIAEALLLACLLSILGQFGDLFESWIKRVFAVKDSGKLLPGHGGILDRIDSLIFPAVFVSAYLKVFHS
jgi:phosphatidate cytidylyltransferase